MPESPSGVDEYNDLFERDPDVQPIADRRDEDDLTGRKELRRQVLSITDVWIGFVIVITGLQFFARLFGAGLESEEYIALITTTTLGLFGLWRVVGKSLYPMNGSADNGENK